MSPTLLNSTVVLWLQAIHHSLPQLVKQRYSTELRGKTLSTLREDISESLTSLLAEIHGETAASIARSASYNNNNRSRYQDNNNRSRYQDRQLPYRQKSTSSKFCAICDAAGRASDHFLSECSNLPEADRRFMSTRARMRAVEVDEDEEGVFYEGAVSQVAVKPDTPKDRAVIKNRIRKVTVKSSPYLYVNFRENSVKLIIDSGAQSNVMRLDYAKKIGATIYKASYGATQANGVTYLDVAGEVHVVFQLDNLNLYFDGLVTKDLSDDVLAGVPFMDTNDVYARPAQRKVFFGERAFNCDIVNMSRKADIIRVQQPVVLLPGDSLTIPVPEALFNEDLVAIEPRVDAPSLRDTKFQRCWLQPQITNTENQQISLVNQSTEVVSVKRFEQIATVRAVQECSEPILDQLELHNSSLSQSIQQPSDYKRIVLDPDNMIP